MTIRKRLPLTGIESREEERASAKEERVLQEKSHERHGCCSSLKTFLPSAQRSNHTLIADQQQHDQQKTHTNILTVLASIAVIIMIFNQIQLSRVVSANGGMPTPTGIALVAASIVPTGVPAIYGKELGISYDDVSANNPQQADRTIALLRTYDEQFTLSGNALDRYITITSQISCEYCCGVPSIIFTKEDEQRVGQQIEAAIAAGKITREQAKQYQKKAGEAACGCAHSFAMRGLAKYLLTNHGDEFSDEQILEELAKWKTLFFPTQMNMKAQAMKEKNIPFSYATLGSNQYRGLEKEAAGNSAGGSGMVGGC